MDLVILTVDIVSIGLLILALTVGARTLRAFRVSKQALRESSSLLEAVVNALTSRIQLSESVVSDLRSRTDVAMQATAEIAGEQTRLRTSYLALLRHMQEALTNDRRLIVELEQIKIRLSSFSQNQRRDTPVMVRNNVDLSMSAENVLSSLTPTERQILQILADGRAKGAPDLGVRLNKSREHMARLMKKLYFEGYVNRESNRSPFKYTLNDKLRPNLGLAGESINQQASQSV